MSAAPVDQLPPSNQKQVKASTQVMVDNALKSLNERSGSSVIAIKKFLIGAYGIDVEKSSRLIKKYIKESVDIGKIIQTRGTGLSGSFKLSPAALKGPKTKTKKIEPKAGAEAKGKKAKEIKDPTKLKATKDGATKTGETAGKKETKKTTDTKSSKAPKLSAVVSKKKATDKTEPAKKKPTKKQETQAVKSPPKKKAPAEKKAAKLPAKNKKGKENIPPSKEKPQAKKKEETVAVAPEVPESVATDEESEEDSVNEAPTIKIKQAISFEEPPSEEETEEPEHENSENEEEMEPLVAEMEDQNSSDESVSHESSPEIAKVKAKGKVTAKSTKKRKSIATLVNSAKPKISKK